MESFGEYLLLLLRQFAGGPGPIENNLARFSLAALMWLGLLVIAWSRQRNQDLPREKLLVWGFGLALARELVMFGLASGRITGFLASGGKDIYFHPLEHGLSMAAVVVVAGAFLRYVLDDERISRRYLQIGLSITILATLVTFITWPKFARANPEVHFKETWETWIFHLPSAILIAAAIFILARKSGWLRTVVSVALGFLFISEFLLLVNFVTNNAYNHILCPIGNTFQLLAIPVFGFVYLKEMSIDKKKAEEELDDYRNHLEDLVNERTAMLSAQNAIADSLSQSLDLETILTMALDKVLPVLSMEVGLIFLLDRDRKDLSLESYHGRLSEEDLELCITEGCPYKNISICAVDDKQVIIQNLTDESQPRSTHIEREGIQSLVSAPLISKNHIVGALTLGSKKAHPLNEADLELLTAVCNQVGMAVENAYLFQEAELWAEELSMLHQASVNLGSTLDPEQINREIATQSARLTGCQMACVIHWDKQCETLEVVSSFGIRSEIEDFLSRHPDACDLLNELRITRNSIVIDDVKQSERLPESWKAALDIHSLLCTPVWGVNEPIEFLFLMDQRETRSWRSKDVELVESFVSRAAVALENANLHKQLEWAAALEERQRIAANMHDGLAQTISLLGLKVDQTAGLIPSESNGKVLQALGDIRETLNQASTEVRRSIASLQNTPQPRKSLQETLASFVEQRSAENEPAFDLTLSFPEPLFLPPDQDTLVIPIIQEAIMNAWKHSDASRVNIHGQQIDDLVSVTVEDDGRGFDVDESISRDESHFGLRIMRARAARLGGKLQIISKPGHGTIITLSWMLDSESDGGEKNTLQQPGHPELPPVEGETFA